MEGARARTPDLWAVGGILEASHDARVPNWSGDFVSQLRYVAALGALVLAFSLAAPARAAAPPAPRWAQATAGEGGNEVSVAFDDVDGVRFQLHRGTTATFTPAAGTLVATCPGTP